jgi:5-methylcytosine-specific restriction enzyme A
MPRLPRLPSTLAAAPRTVGYSDRAAAQRARDRTRRQADNLRKLYNTKRWRDLRQVILARDGWTCRQTQVLLIGKAHAPNSPVIDHIKKPDGNLALFWDEANLQAVSKVWHDSEKQRLEKSGTAQAQRGGGSNR